VRGGSPKAVGGRRKGSPRLRRLPNSKAGVPHTKIQWAEMIHEVRRVYHDRPNTPQIVRKCSPGVDCPPRESPDGNGGSKTYY